ncbi:MAG TPA: tetratricopeptide repeat protein [Pyrinomonadaceae bacterium]
MYCGSEVIVREAIQAAASASVPNLLRLANAAARSGNHQEAYDYFTRVLEFNVNNAEAWAGKAEAAGWLTNQQSFRIPEMINYFSTALEVALPDERPGLESKAANVIGKVITHCYTNLRSVLSPGFAEGNVWTLYLTKLGELFTAVDKAHRAMPDSTGILRLGIYLFEANHGSLSYVSRITGKTASRSLPSQWQSYIRDKWQSYLDELARLDPTLRPLAPQPKRQIPSFFTTPIPLRWGVIIGVILLFGISMLIGGFSEKKESSTSNSSGSATLEETRLKQAARSFLITYRSHCQSAADAVASLQKGNNNLPDIKRTLEKSRSFMTSSWTNDYLMVAEKGVPAKLTPIDNRLRDLNQHQKEAFDELLSYWKDRKTLHITNGSALLNKLLTQSAEILKDVENLQ